MDWYRHSQFNPSTMSEDEFINYHKTRGIPPVKRGRGGSVFKWYKTDDYPTVLFTGDFGGHTIEFRGGRDIDPTKVVAFDGDRAVGIAAEHWDYNLPEGQSGDGYWVDSDYQRLGIGLRLMILFRSQFSEDRRIGEMSPSGENLVRRYYKQLHESSL